MATVWGKPFPVSNWQFPKSMKKWFSEFCIKELKWPAQSQPHPSPSELWARCFRPTSETNQQSHLGVRFGCLHTFGYVVYDQSHFFHAGACQECLDSVSVWWQYFKWAYIELSKHLSLSLSLFIFYRVLSLSLPRSQRLAAPWLLFFYLFFLSHCLSMSQTIKCFVSISMCMSGSQFAL